MEILIKDFDELSNKEIYEILKLREEVFIIEQNCIYPDIDGKDYNCKHLIVKDQGEVAAYLRIIPAGICFPTASIGRVLVKEEYRREGLGYKMLNKAIENIKDDITIEAQYYLLDFYKELKFREDSDVYLEDGIKHIKMVFEY